MGEVSTLIGKNLPGRVHPMAIHPGWPGCEESKARPGQPRQPRSVVCLEVLEGEAGNLLPVGLHLDPDLLQNRPSTRAVALSHARLIGK